jgi:hypothetical protein
MGHRQGWEWLGSYAKAYTFDTLAGTIVVPLPILTRARVQCVGHQRSCCSRKVLCHQIFDDDYFVAATRDSAFISGFQEVTITQ